MPSLLFLAVAAVFAALPRARLSSDEIAERLRDPAARQLFEHARASGARLARDAATGGICAIAQAPTPAFNVKLGGRCGQTWSRGTAHDGQAACPVYHCR